MDFTFFLSLSHLQVLIPLPDPLRFPEQDLGPLLGQRQRDGQIALLVYQLDFFHLERRKGENKKRDYERAEEAMSSYGFLPVTLFLFKWVAPL